MTTKRTPPKTIDPVYGNAPDVLPGPKDRKAFVEDSQRAHNKLTARLKQSRDEFSKAITKRQAADWASSAANTVAYYAPLLHDIALQPVRAGRAPRELVPGRHDDIVKIAKKLQRRGVEPRRLVSQTALDSGDPQSTVRRALASAGLIPPPKKRM